MFRYNFTYYITIYGWYSSLIACSRVTKQEKVHKYYWALFKRIISDGSGGQNRFSVLKKIVLYGLFLFNPPTTIHLEGSSIKICTRASPRTCPRTACLRWQNQSASSDLVLYWWDSRPWPLFQASHMCGTQRIWVKYTVFIMIANLLILNFWGSHLRHTLWKWWFSICRPCVRNKFFWYERGKEKMLAKFPIVQCPDFFFLYSERKKSL